MIPGWRLSFNVRGVLVQAGGHKQKHVHPDNCRQSATVGTYTQRTWADTQRAHRWMYSLQDPGTGTAHHPTPLPPTEPQHQGPHPLQLSLRHSLGSPVLTFPYQLSLPPPPPSAP